MHFRLRVSQSHVRSDLTPSHWSHVALMGGLGAGIERAELHGIPLDGPHGYGFAPKANAVVTETLADYADEKRFRNIAFIRVPASWQAVQAQLDRFQKQRAVLDAVELVVRWLAYVWGVGRSGNPLVEGQGMPSAAMAETVIGGARFELTPGLASRSSCPEAIWQSARWWHTYYQAERPGQAAAAERRDAAPRELTGAWCVEHWFVEEPAAASASRR